MEGVDLPLTLLELAEPESNTAVEPTGSCHRLCANSHSTFYASHADLICDILNSFEPRGAEAID